MSQVIFIYAPAKMDDFKVFTPNRILANLSEILSINNVANKVYDFAIPQALEFIPMTPHKVKHPTKKSKLSSYLKKLFKKDNHFHTNYKDYIEWIIRSINSTSETKCILFWIDTREDLILARSIIQRIREDDYLHEITIVGAGTYFKYTGPGIVPYLDGFQGIILNHPELAILPLWRSIVTESSLSSVPNFAYFSNAGIQLGPAMSPESLDEFPIPSYTYYPAVQSGLKFKIFTLEQTRDGKTSGYQEPITLRQPINATIERILEEINYIRKNFYTSTFHIEGNSSTTTDIQTLSKTLLKFPHLLTYSRGLNCMNLQGELANSMHLTGGCAVHIHVPTGSQRLLSNFYGHMRTISSLESAITSFKSSEFYILLEMNYPAPVEDRHTFAETIRFIQRVKPNGVKISPVWLWPHSHWWNNPYNFNFQFEEDEYLLWLAGELNEVNYLDWRPFNNEELEEECLKLGVYPSSSPIIGNILHIFNAAQEQRFFHTSFQQTVQSANIDAFAELTSRFNKLSKEKVRDEEWNLREYGFKAVAN